MDDIENFFQEFLDRYPKYWPKIDSYVENLLSKEIDVFDFKPKYVKPHTLNKIDDKITYRAKEKLTEQQIEKIPRILDMNLIDYEEVFKDFDETSFDVEEWATHRLEHETKMIKTFLFECDFFKGYYFLERLICEIDEIRKNLKSIWKPIEPNWLQTEITDELINNLRYLKETIDEDFPKVSITNELSSKSKSKSKFGNWHKIAELMADGIITIDDRGTKYFFKGDVVEVEKKMSELVSEELKGVIKPSSIKPYLNRTKINSECDKNIFRDFRLNELTIIAANAENAGSLSSFFKSRLEQLKNSIN